MALGFFKSKETNEIDKDRLPQHIAIIMDGNGRWAKKRMMPRLIGHKEGVETIREIIKHASQMGIRHMTFYAFSTENWKRPEDEVNGLMELLVNYIRSEIDELHKNNVRMNFIGYLEGLPDLQLREIRRAIAHTGGNTGLSIHIAVNYGSRDEMIRATRKMVESVQAGELALEDVNEKTFADALFTAGIPDPDLVIRTSGEERLSNFLLWQLAYSEFYFTEVLWPDFKSHELDKAILEYQRRHRRYGGI